MGGGGCSFNGVTVIGPIMDRPTRIAAVLAAESADRWLSNITHLD